MLRERQQAFRAMLPRGMAVYVLAFLFLPIVKLLGLAGDGPMLVVASEIAAIVAIFAVTLWRGWRVNSVLVTTIVTLHVSLLATIGFVLGPLLVLPMLVFGSLPIFLMTPTVRFPKTVLVLHVLAFVVPELLHVQSWQLGQLVRSSGSHA
ncbi:MAG: hypothetical protein HOV81_24050 [Kofleriaceae bacterium]|nr:hypothetical protein [Kofleriaceae bacterium]